MLTTLVASAKTTRHNKPDAFASRVTHIATDKEGHISSTLESNRVIHFTNSQTTVFTAPKLTIISKNNKNPWIITAEKGKSYEKENRVVLQGHVKIHQDGTAKAPAITLHTSTLTVYTKKKIAQTQAPVTIERKGLVVHAKGLRGDLEKGTMELLSNVHGIYDGKTTGQTT